MLPCGDTPLKSAAAWVLQLRVKLAVLTLRQELHQSQYQRVQTTQTR